MNDAEILDACPEFISIGGVFKSHAAVEDGKRVVYFEASNEGLDYQGEIVVAKALAESADYYKRYGIVDLDHVSQLGPKLGVPNYASYEIGRPTEVRQTGNSTFVKATVYSGEGPVAEKANMFWSSITDVNPPQRWYPSVAGQSLDRVIEVGTDGVRKAFIKRMRWSGVGLSKTPVNQHVGTCATIPVGAFAKAMTATGLDIAKALTAGYGTDSASLSGGAALRGQSLEGVTVNYFEFRNRMAKAMRNGECGTNPRTADIHAYAVGKFGMSPDQATQHVERFLRDIKDKLRSAA